jgi:short-subunit dehydrogenase
VKPGFVETEGFPQARLPRPLRRLVIGPEQIAEHIVESVERGRGETTVPRYYAAAGVLQALVPNLVTRTLVRARERSRITS